MARACRIVGVPVDEHVRSVRDVITLLSRVLRKKERDLVFFVVLDTDGIFIMNDLDKSLCVSRMCTKLLTGVLTLQE